MFYGKTAIVTGGGSGIGRELALHLADAGAKVIITDIVKERLDAVVKELDEKGACGAGYEVDHSSLESAQAFADAFLKEWGAPDILCCNAGVGSGGRLEELSLEDWEWMVNINLWGPIHMIRLFAPKMIERKSGAILITSSAAGLVGLPGMSHYCTTKFAMVGLAESLRCELAAHNISVSALCPGVINTNIVADGRIYVDDGKGGSLRDKAVAFYRDRGTDPAVVAKQALNALAKDVGVIPSPFHVWPMYALKRLAPSLYQGAARFVWKSGLLT